MEKITIPTSHKLWAQLGKVNSNFLDLLSEFIDNSIEEMHENNVNVVITIGGEWKKGGKAQNPVLDLASAYIEIEDDACGMHCEEIPECISPAARSTENNDSLHEHGMGMKGAIMALGRLDYMITKTEGERLATKLYGPLDWEMSQERITWDKPHGTLIRINNLTSCVRYTRKADYTNHVINQLGAKYRYYLEGLPNGKKLSVTIRLVDANGTVGDSNGQGAEWSLKPVKPYYRTGRPYIPPKVISVKGGEFIVTLGFAPTESEYEDWGIEAPKKHFLYQSGHRRIDVFLHDRMIRQFSLSDFGVNENMMVVTPVRGEIKLLKGFQTTIDKNDILDSASWEKLKKEVSELLKDCLKIDRSKFGYTSESEVADRISNLYKNMDIEVQSQYYIECIGTRADLLVNKVIWEIKKDEAGADAVMQLLGYIRYADSPDIDKSRGVIVARSFSENAFNAISKVKEKDGIEISLKTFDDFKGL